MVMLDDVLREGSRLLRSFISQAFCLVVSLTKFIFLGHTATVRVCTERCNSDPEVFSCDLDTEIDPFTVHRSEAKERFPSDLKSL